jgi:hypothetical protein
MSIGIHGEESKETDLVACDLRNRILSNRSETRIACPNAFPSGGIDHTSIREITKVLSR